MYKVPSVVCVCPIIPDVNVSNFGSDIHHLHYNNEKLKLTMEQCERIKTQVNVS